MCKKKKLILGIISVVLMIAIIITVYLLSKNKSSNLEDKIQEIYNYGDYIEEQDIKPNTIVAKFNGEEILFREIETARKSINYSIDNGKEENENKNAFYEVLEKKLYIELAKKYPDEVVYNLNIEQNLEKVKKEWSEGYGEKNAEEYRKDYLDVLGIEKDEIWLNENDFLKYLQNISIEQMLSAKGMQIVYKFMLEKPELANDKILEEKVNTYKELQDAQKDMTDKEEMLNAVKDGTKLLTEIRELYVKDLIINSNIEFCADKGELSTKVPEIYSENKLITNSNENNEKSNIKNYNENVKIAYSDENNKNNSEFIYYNDSISNQYQWNSYIIENKVITKDMEEIDFSKFEKLDNEFYSIKITEAKVYNEYAKKYGFKELKESDFENIFVNIIIRKNTDYSINYDDIITGYENYDDTSNKGEKNYTLPVKTGGILDVDENFKYPCIVGYFPNYMYKNYNSFYFKVLPIKNDIKISSDKALQIAKNYLKKLSYSGVDNFSDMDYLRISNEFENNFLNIEDKEHPIEDTSKQHTVWNISAYSIQDPCTWANVYIDIVSGKIIGGKLYFAMD